LIDWLSFNANLRTISAILLRRKHEMWCGWKWKL